MYNEEFGKHSNAALINKKFIASFFRTLFRKRFSLHFINQITRNLIGSRNVDKRNYVENWKINA